ncbi:hypothetical protein ES703_86767 [subsurface metagenome]
MAYAGIVADFTAVLDDSVPADANVFTEADVRMNRRKLIE